MRSTIKSKYIVRPGKVKLAHRSPLTAHMRASPEPLDRSTVLVRPVGKTQIAQIQEDDLQYLLWQTEYEGRGVLMPSFQESQLTNIRHQTMQVRFRYLVEGTAGLDELVREIGHLVEGGPPRATRRLEARAGHPIR